VKKFLVLAGISILLLFSCSTTVGKGMVFDDSVPVEKSSQIMTYAGTITGYNGITVKWKPTMKNMLQIPSGKTVLEFEIDFTPGYIRYRGSGWLFLYDFQPNKKYFLYFVEKDDLWGFNVYTYNIGEELPMGAMKSLEPNFTAFVPFANNKPKEKIVLD